MVVVSSERLRVTLPLIERAQIGRALLLGYLMFCALYLTSAHWAVREPAMLQPGPIDRVMPFAPWSIWIYLSQALLLPLSLLLASSDHQRSRAFYAMLGATLLCAPIFLLWPTQLLRPAVPDNGLTGYAWQLLYTLDTPANCFPSLHVALAALAALALGSNAVILRWLAWLWASAIMIATLSTRQHVSFDVAGGLAVAATAWISSGYLLHYERTRATQHAAGD